MCVCVCMLLQPGICITGTLGSTLNSTAVSVVEDIVVELTNTETAVATVATPPTVRLFKRPQIEAKFGANEN